MSDPTCLAVAGGFLVSFFIGTRVGRPFVVPAPRVPTARQLRSWRRDRLVLDVPNRRPR